MTLSGLIGVGGRTMCEPALPGHQLKPMEWAYFFSVFFAAASLVWWMYFSALEAPWFFDDAVNLGGVSQVHDFESAWKFIFSGVASSLGRPVANFTFLLNVNDWPDNPAGFRLVTLVIHSLSATLLCFLSIRVLNILGLFSVRQRVWFSIFMSLVWFAHPVHFSAWLMPVQRMTHLAGFFVLLGLHGYVSCVRYFLHKAEVRALVLGSLGMVFSGLLGVLSKENAVLLPFYAWTLHVLISGVVTERRIENIEKIWRFLFFYLPAMLLFVYVVFSFESLTARYEVRPFDLAQRIATESVILWDYLRLILLPDITSYSPFHDGFPVFNLLSWQAISAIAVWAAIIGGLVFYGRRCLYIRFAVSWFLVGHLLESTVIPLELYFEHRNYISSIGPVFIAFGGLVCVKRIRRIMPVTLGCIIIFSLWRISSVWSDNLVAAKTLERHHPLSVRAAQFVAIEYDRRGDVASALEQLDKSVAKFPLSSFLQSARLQLSCSFSSDIVDYAYSDFMKYVDNVDGTYGTADPLYSIWAKISQEDCVGLEFVSFDLLTERLSRNSNVMANKGLAHHIHHIRSSAFISVGEYKKSIEELMLAHKYAQNPETIILVSGLLLREGEINIALDFLDTELTLLTRNRRLRPDWKGDALHLREQICAVLDYECKVPKWI